MGDGKPEQELITRAVSGNQPALEELLLTCYDRLCERIRRKLPVPMRGVTDEEDILQQTFADVFLRITSFQPRVDGSFFGWVATIAEHRLQDAIKAHRAAKRGGRLDGAAVPARRRSESMNELIDLLTGGGDTPSQSVAREEAVAAVQIGLASLRKEYRHSIELRYFQGLGVGEAAEAMNKTPRAVRHLCHCALRDLRTVLGRSSQYFSRK